MGCEASVPWEWQSEYGLDSWEQRLSLGDGTAVLEFSQFSTFRQFEKRWKETVELRTGASKIFKNSLPLMRRGQWQKENRKAPETEGLSEVQRPPSTAAPWDSLEFFDPRSLHLRDGSSHVQLTCLCCQFYRIATPGSQQSSSHAVDQEPTMSSRENGPSCKRGQGEGHRTPSSGQNSQPGEGQAWDRTQTSILSPFLLAIWSGVFLLTQL